MTFASADCQHVERSSQSQLLHQIDFKWSFTPTSFWSRLGGLGGLGPDPTNFCSIKALFDSSDMDMELGLAAELQLSSHFLPEMIKPLHESELGSILGMALMLLLFCIYRCHDATTCSLHQFASDSNIQHSPLFYKKKIKCK